MDFKAAYVEQRRLARKVRRATQRVAKASAEEAAALETEQVFADALMQEAYSSDANVEAYTKTFRLPPRRTPGLLRHFWDAFERASNTAEALDALQAIRRVYCDFPPGAVVDGESIWWVPVVEVLLGDQVRFHRAKRDAEPMASAWVTVRAGIEPGLTTQRVAGRVLMFGIRMDGTVLQQEQPLEAVVPPVEPRCLPGAQHDWMAHHAWVGGLPTNPGVFPSPGGGLVVQRICHHCGCGRRVDTTAVDTDGTLYEKTTYDPALGRPFVTALVGT